MKIAHTLHSDTPEDYTALVDLARTQCAFFLLVVRRLSSVRPSLRLVLDDLGEDLRDTSERSEWPGTRLLGRKATVFAFHLNERSASKLVRWSSRFSEWCAPERPEDLAFLRKDESVWLGSIAHEGVVFLELSEDEVRDIQSTHPTLAEKIVRDVSDADL